MTKTKINVYTLDSFSKWDWGWNPAGVVINSDKLTDKDMRSIAKKVWFSETAFVFDSKVATKKIRFFTPAEEVDLCWHASIATFYLLNKLWVISSWNYTQETKAGILWITITWGWDVYMSQNLPQFWNTITDPALLESLGIKHDQLSKDMPVQIVSTGLKDIMIPINTYSDLIEIEPDFEKISKISKKYGVVGYHVFSLETLHSSTAHCRNFAPLYDIDEESATWTSCWALACYLFNHRRLHTLEDHNLIFEQWYCMSSWSEIKVNLHSRSGNISSIEVWWRATNMKSIEVEI